MVEASGRRLWLSCLAALAMIGILAMLLLPDLVAMASPVSSVAQDNPIRVRVSPAVGALGGGVLEAGSDRYHSVTVHNDGRGSFVYDVSVLADGGLADVIVLEVRAWSGACNAATFANAIPVAGPRTLTAMHHQGSRVLPAGAHDRLCARLSMPADLPSELQHGVTDATLRITAVEN